MSKQLSKEEIDKRIQEWRNIKVLYDKAIERNKIQAKTIKSLKEQNNILEEKNKTLEKTVETLKLQVEELRTIVFGKKKDDNDNNFTEKELNRKERRLLEKKKRNKNSYKREIPKEKDITNIEEYKINTCPHCNTKLINKINKEYYEEDIIFPKKKIIKKIIEKGYCNVCKKWHTIIPLPTAKVYFGNNIKKHIVYQSIILRLSNQQIIDDLLNTFNLKISSGEIVKIIYLEGEKQRINNERIKEKIRKEKVIHFDETGDRIRDKKEFRSYTWIMQGSNKPEISFIKGRTRGIGNAKDLYGNSNAILVSDDYRVYKNLTEEHQLCWAHLHRKLRDLAESKTLSKEVLNVAIKSFKKERKIYSEIRNVLKKDELTQQERDNYVNKFTKELNNLSITNPLDPKKLKTYKETLKNNIPKYLTCIKYTNVPADNNQAERSLRHIVLKRKISFGHITEKGAETMSILFSVFLTIKNRIRENGKTFWEEYDSFVV